MHCPDPRQTTQPRLTRGKPGLERLGTVAVELDEGIGERLTALGTQRLGQASQKPGLAGQRLNPLVHHLDGGGIVLHQRQRRRQRVAEAREPRDHQPFHPGQRPQLDPDAGVMITGSHNPPEYNGFKVAVGSLTIHGEQIQEVRKIAESGDFLSGEGNKEERSLLSSYRDYLAQALGRLDPPLRVVVDAGNGTGAVLGPQVYRDMGCQVIELYCTMDGNFPNHHPDPTVVENLQDLIETVREEKADLGIAFDGDTDRIGAVDDEGNIIWGDDLSGNTRRSILNMICMIWFGMTFWTNNKRPIVDISVNQRAP